MMPQNQAMNRLQQRRAEALASSIYTPNTERDAATRHNDCSVPREVGTDKRETLRFTFTTSTSTELCQDHSLDGKARSSAAQVQNSVSDARSAKFSTAKICQDGQIRSAAAQNVMSDSSQKHSAEISTAQNLQDGQSVPSASPQNAMSSSTERCSEHTSTTEICTAVSSSTETDMPKSSQRCSGEICTTQTFQDGPAGSSAPVQSSMSGEPAQKSTAELSRESSSPPSEKIDTALHTLKSELMAMREQDLQLLKQLIHINDNIRRLKRARWLQRGGRTASCGTLLGARTPSNLSLGSTPGGGPKERGSMLVKQRSEPGLLGLPSYRRVSTLTSTSSFETIEDEEEADSLYGSASDLPSDNSPVPSPLSPFSQPAPTTPLIRSPTPYTSLTFTQEELWRGESSYGEILKRNVRLWKWSVARKKETGIVDGHPCVL